MTVAGLAGVGPSLSLSVFIDEQHHGTWWHRQSAHQHMLASDACKQDLQVAKSRVLGVMKTLGADIVQGRR